MAPVELAVRIGSSAPFPVEIDDTETVKVLANVVLSMNSEIGDPPRLVHKGKVLKDHQVIQEVGIHDGETVVVVPSKRTEASAQPEVPRAPAEGAAQAGTGNAVQGAGTAPPTAGPAVPAAATRETEVFSAQPPEDVVAELCNMGFDRPKVLQALQAAFNSPERAVEYLFNGIPSSATALASPAQQGAPDGQAAAWPESMLGPQLLTKAGLQSTRQALADKAVVALYFSAHWCPPCRQFTPLLSRALAQPLPQLAVVFVSSDHDEASFMQYYSEMPWLALPFGSFQKQLLGTTFGVRGIPSLVILNGATGQLISADGRSDVTGNNFDMARCLRAWGAPAPEAAAAPKAEVKDAAPPPPPKEVGPTPLPIDDAVVDAALARVANEQWDVQEPFFKTGLKVLDNVLQNPGETKFRQLKTSNAALQSKLLAVADSAGLVLMDAAGFKPSANDVLTLPGPPDGQCTAVRNKVQAAATAAWEKQARAERDAKIQQEIEKDKERTSRYSGGGGDRMELGRGRGPSRSGGG